MKHKRQEKDTQIDSTLDGGSSSDDLEESAGKRPDSYLDSAINSFSNQDDWDALFDSEPTVEVVLPGVGNAEESKGSASVGNRTTFDGLTTAKNFEGNSSSSANSSSASAAVNSPHDDPNVIRVRKKRNNKKKHTVRNIAIAVVAVFLVLTGVMGGLAFGQSQSIKTNVRELNTNLKAVESSFMSGDFASANTSVAAASSNIKGVQSALNSPALTYFSFFPVVGGDIANAKIIVENASVVLDKGLAPVCDSLANTGVGTLISADKTINYQAVDAIVSPVKNNAAEISAALSNIESANDFKIAQISSQVTPVIEKISGTEEVVNAVAQYAAEIEKMLGSAGNRKYLLVAQNTAEMRSTGGYPGSMGTISITNGKIELGNFSAAADVLNIPRTTAIPPTDLDNAIYPLSVVYNLDTGYDAHFPNSAKVWLQAYTEKHGEQLNGVISLSPSMVQDVLEVVGAITLSDGTTLDGTNATKVLQHDLYWKYLSGSTSSADNEKADAIFAEAASMAFDKLFENLSTSTIFKLAMTLPNSIENREFMAYMADTNEQITVEALGASASLSAPISQNKLGIFCGVRSACKLGWWLDKDFSIQKTSDTTYKITVLLRNTVTKTEASTGGAYIMGIGGDPGNIAPWFYVFAPSGGKITNMQVNKQNAGTEYTQEGRQLYALGTISTEPEETSIITFDLEVPSDFGDKLEIETNPALTDYR